jgi:hypothetical protein
MFTEVQPLEAYFLLFWYFIKKLRNKHVQNLFSNSGFFESRQPG